KQHGRLLRGFGLRFDDDGCLSAQTERRGRCRAGEGAHLAVRTPPAALLVERRQLSGALDKQLGALATGDRRTSSVITVRDQLPAAAGAQGLEDSEVRGVAHEANRAVDEGEVGAALMATAEGTSSIKHLRYAPAARHLIVDRHGGVERDVYQAT